MHLRLDLQTLLPRFAILDQAPHYQNTRAVELCVGLKEGEIAIFDKAYLSLAHLWQLTQRGVFWVTRARENMDWRVVRRRLTQEQGAVPVR